MDRILSQKFNTLEIDELKTLKFSNGVSVLNPDDKQVLYFIMTSKMSNSELIGFLKSKIWKSGSDLIFHTPVFSASRRYAITRMENLERPAEIKTGISCRLCGQKTAFLAERRQLRSGDEAMTMIYQCSSCGREWRVNP